MVLTALPFTPQSQELNKKNHLHHLQIYFKPIKVVKYFSLLLLVVSCCSAARVRSAMTGSLNLDLCVNKSPLIEVFYPMKRLFK